MSLSQVRLRRTTAVAVMEATILMPRHVINVQLLSNATAAPQVQNNAHLKGKGGALWQAPRHVDSAKRAMGVSKAPVIVKNALSTSTITRLLMLHVPYKSVPRVRELCLPVDRIWRWTVKTVDQSWG